MIIIKGQRYQSIKSEDLKPGDSILVFDNEPVTCSYTQAQVAELMNIAYNKGYATCAYDRNDDDT